MTGPQTKVAAVGVSNRLGDMVKEEQVILPDLVNNKNKGKKNMKSYSYSFGEEENNNIFDMSMGIKKHIDLGIQN